MFNVHFVVGGLLNPTMVYNWYIMKKWYERVTRATHKEQLLVAAVGLVAGMLLFIYYNELIIVRWPARASSIQQVASAVPTVRKVVMLTFFKHGSFKNEQQELLWGDRPQENIRYLLSALLNLWEDEQVTQKKVSLQSAILNPSGQTLYLSFDRAPFDKEAPTFHKWHAVEAILKTLRDNEVGVREVYFLVHHELLVDPHLDFSNPWPLGGFL